MHLAQSILHLAVRAWLLAYTITSNHVHLLIYAQDSRQVAEMIQQAAGEFARDYNRRKRRSGAFDDQ